MTDNYKQELRTYLTGLVPSRPPELQKMEAYAKQHRFPIIGPVSGHFCYQVARMIGARKIFELGSGYGYSTAWFAQAVEENGGGEVHHVVWDDELSNMARQHLGAMGFERIIRYRVSEAVQALRETQGPFDLIFNDIHKDLYPASLPVIESKLRPGGILIVDNMIWGGSVFDDSDQSVDTQGIRELTRLLTTSNHWIGSVIPVGDGLMMA
ncbi:MAG: O-methyltransferase, partial [Ardenticatenaceae bacterium]